MLNFNFKRLIAVIAVTLGVCFTSFILLAIWEIIDAFQYETILNKLITTLGVLTLAFVVLLGIIKMVEDRDRTQVGQE